MQYKVLRRAFCVEYIAHANAMAHIAKTAVSDQYLWTSLVNDTSATKTELERLTTPVPRVQVRCLLVPSWKFSVVSRIVWLFRSSLILNIQQGQQRRTTWITTSITEESHWNHNLRTPRWPNASKHSVVLWSFPAEMAVR